MMNYLKPTLLALVAVVFLVCCSESDDPDKELPTLSISDATADEGDELTFEISLSAPATETVTVKYTTQNNTADGGDYTAVSTAQEVEILPDETSASIVISTKTDSDDGEDAETFNVILASPANATILDGEGVGTIENVISYFMKATIGGSAWVSRIGGFFGAEFIGSTLGSYGTDGDSQLSIIFKNEPTGAKTYGIEDSILSPDSDDNVIVSYSPNFFSSSGLGTVFTGQPGGEFVITKYDTEALVAEGTFSLTVSDDDENSRTITNGSFKVPIAE